MSIRRRIAATVALLVLARAPALAQTPEPVQRDPYRRALESDKLGDRAYKPRIVGGATTTLKENPWQVAVLVASISDNFRAHFCGAVAIGGKWVLTAAHCVFDRDAKDLHLLWGTDNLNSGGRRRTVTWKAVHPKYNDEVLDNDVALLEMDEPITGKGIELISNAEMNGLLNAADKDRHAEIWITGWGTIVEWGVKSAKLRGTKVPLQGYDACSMPDSYEGRISDAMICAGYPIGGTDACQADSGGPASALLPGGRRVLVGLISWGDGCAAAKKYGVYTNVSKFVAWIEDEKKKRP